MQYLYAERVRVARVSGSVTCPAHLSGGKVP